MILVSLVLYTYLTSEHYAVKYGTASGDSICSINDTFNCEAVAASKYSSMVADIPNAILGFVLAFIMLIALFGILISSDDEKNNENWRQFFGFLASINLLASIVMGSIALFAMSVYCLFCICLYILSIGIFGLFFYGFNYRPNLPINLVSNKTFLSLLIAVPALSFLGHKIIKNEYSPAAQEKEISQTIKSWQKKKTVDLGGAEPLFTLNPGGKVKIAEFADFLCPHCATAAATMKNFLNLHHDVEFSFYSYPLDPKCNKNFKNQPDGPGFNCTLAAGVLCAQKQGKGVELHYDIFENQRYYRNVAVSKNNEGLIDQMASILKDINLDSWKSCLSDEATNSALIESAKLGKSAGVQGTPTIYMNDRKLNGGAFYLILKAAYETSN